MMRRILKPTQDAVDYHREIAAQLADITRDLRSMWCHLACCAETIQSISMICDRGGHGVRPCTFTEAVSRGGVWGWQVGRPPQAPLL